MSPGHPGNWEAGSVAEGEEPHAWLQIPELGSQLCHWLSDCSRQVTSGKLSPIIFQAGTTTIIVTQPGKSDDTGGPGGKGQVSRVSPNPRQNSGVGRHLKTASSLAHWDSRSWAKASFHRNLNTAFFLLNYWGGWSLQGAAETASERNVFNFRFLSLMFPNVLCSCYHLPANRPGANESLTRAHSVASRACSRGHRPRQSHVQEPALWPPAGEGLSTG